MSRAYNIQINVGDLDHELMGLSDAERAAWLAGFQAGLHGKGCPAGHGPSQHAGNMFGYACFERTKKFMEQAAANGVRSAAARKAKHGTAQPPKAVRRTAEGASKVVRENAEVTSNQKPETINHKRETAPASHCDLFDPPIEPPAQASAPHMAACDAKFASGDTLAGIRKFMGKLTKQNGNLPEWQSLVDEHGWDAVSDAARKVGPAERWPDKVAQVIFDRDKCPHPPGTEAYQNWWALHMDLKC